VENDCSELSIERGIDARCMYSRMRPAILALLGANTFKLTTHVNTFQITKGPFLVLKQSVNLAD